MRSGLNGGVRIPGNSDGKMNPIFQKVQRFFSPEEGQTAAEDRAEIQSTCPSSGSSAYDRRSCRWPVPPAGQACTLKVGNNVLSASLVDKSRGGLSVLVDHLAGLTVGDEVELNTAIESCVVQVIYVRKALRPADTPPEHEMWFRVGLKKVRSSLSVSGASANKRQGDPNGDQDETRDRATVAGGENRASPSANGAVALRGGAESSAVSNASVTSNSDLAAVVAAWPNLPEDVKLEILRLVEQGACR
jgi:hypothetical protein